MIWTKIKAATDSEMLLKNFEFKCALLKCAIKMLVQTTNSSGRCVCVLCFVGFFLLFGWLLGFFDKWKKAGTALSTESKDSWQPRTWDIWHAFPSTHGAIQNNSFSTHPKGSANAPSCHAKTGFWWRMLTCCQLLNPPRAHPRFMLEEFHKQSWPLKKERGSHQQEGWQPSSRADTRMNAGLSQMFWGNCLLCYLSWNNSHLYTILMLLLLTCMMSMGLKRDFCYKPLASLICF